MLNLLATIKCKNEKNMRKGNRRRKQREIN